MPWNESNRMDERLRFVARILEGEKMAATRRLVGGVDRHDTPLTRPEHAQARLQIVTACSPHKAAISVVPTG